jgi:hypothetical protein
LLEPRMMIKCRTSDPTIARMIFFLSDIDKRR